MELKDNLKKGGTAYSKVLGHVKIENDPAKFRMYKKLGLDVFKTDEDFANEAEDAKNIKEFEDAKKPKKKKVKKTEE